MKYGKKLSILDSAKVSTIKKVRFVDGKYSQLKPKLDGNDLDESERDWHRVSEDELDRFRRAWRKMISDSHIERTSCVVGSAFTKVDMEKVAEEVDPVTEGCRIWIDDCCQEGSLFKNFFFDGHFYSSMDDLLDADDDIDDLPDDWEATCMHSTLEPIFELTKDFVATAVIDRADHYEDRFPEDYDTVEKEIRSAVEAGIDIDKMNGLLPKLYYPNGTTFKITKKDLIEYFND